MAASLCMHLEATVSTYADKIRKYQAKVEKSQKLGLDPEGDDVARLLYYVGRAEEKGAEHKVGPKDKVKSIIKSYKGDVGKLLERAAKVFLSKQ